MVNKVLREECHALKRDFPLLNNVKADPRLLGFPAFLNPFVQMTSGSRNVMYTSHCAQALVIHGSEFPHIFTSFENNTGKYEINRSVRDQDVLILNVIPKYSSLSMIGSENKSPHFVVIYEGLEDRKIGYFVIDRYQLLSSPFGYKNNWFNTRSVMKDRQINQDTKLVSSPSHRGEQYCMGTNLNVAYLNLQGTVEDSVIVSESAAVKLASDKYEKIIIDIRQDMRPINKYGDEARQKFIPDLGEKVGVDGILCAFRPVSITTVAADTSQEALTQVNDFEDVITYIDPGAIIIDIDVISNRMKKTSSYHQVDEYQRTIILYWQEILDTYNRIKTTHHVTPTFQTLVNDAIKNLLILGQRVPGMAYKNAELEGAGGHTVEFIQVVVTYWSPRMTVENGFKTTDRQGGKGVISGIWPDEHMPIDQNGIRADMIISPDSPIGRMNTGQLYEPGINRISEFVRRRVEELKKTTPDLAYNTLLDWYNDVNPNYAGLVRQTHTTAAQQIAHIDWAIKNGIRLMIPPFLDTITHQNVLAWKNKWGVEVTPVTYTLVDGKGNLRTFTTRHPVAIGSKYILCLAKIPKTTSAGAARVSHQGLPVKPGKDAKYASPVSMVPIRMGEDENRIETMDVAVEEVVRLNHLMSSTPKGVNMAMEEIMLSPYPTRIKRIGISNQELSDANATLALFHHQTSILGIDTRNTLATVLPPSNLKSDLDMLNTDNLILSDWEDSDKITVVTDDTPTVRRRVRLPDDDDEPPVGDADLAELADAMEVGDELIVDPDDALDES